ncbi:MAG: hypothetical protein EBU88_09730 [Acidobacteria bacterium]|nr:hypothetical protein [Acidobacteriota bacterium]
MMTARTIGRYQVISEMTPGSLGPVYLGRQLGQATEMVIRKVPLNRCSPSERVLLLARIRRAAWIQRQLRHPAIVRLQEAFSDGQACYLVSEHIAGTDLRQLLQREWRPGADQAVSMCRQLLAAIDYAHNLRYLDESDLPQVGLLHRDLQPGVVVLDLSGRLRLTGFGVASLPDNPAYPYIGLQPGTLEYLAPELRRGAEADPRTDIFSLGVLMYEMITGLHPYLRYRGEVGVSAGLGREGSLSLETPAVPISQIRLDLDPRLSMVLMQAIDRRPAIRYQTAADFLRALNECGAGSEEPELNESGARVNPPRRRLFAGRGRRMPAIPRLASGQSLKSELAPESVDRILSTGRRSPASYLGLLLSVLVLGVTIRIWLQDGYQLNREAGTASSGEVRAPSKGGSSSNNASQAASETDGVSAVTPEDSPSSGETAWSSNLASGVVLPAGVSAITVDESDRQTNKDQEIEANDLLTKARDADQNGRFGEALNLYEAYVKLGASAVESRDVAIYIEKLRSFITSLETAKQAFEQGDYRRARAAYAEALRLRPYSGFAKAGLEDAEARLAQPEPAAPDPPMSYLEGLWVTVSRVQLDGR